MEICASPHTVRAGSSLAFARHGALAVRNSATTAGAASVFLTLAVGLALQLAHAGQHEAHELPPLLHWLRDATLALPLALLALAVARRAAHRFAGWAGLELGHPLVIAAAAVAGALISAAGAIPGGVVHGALFGAHHEGLGFAQHAVLEARLVFAVSFAGIVAVAAACGLLSADGARGRSRDPRMRRRRAGLLAMVIAPALAVAGSGLLPTGSEAVTGAFKCGATLPGSRTVSADVVALDQDFSYNRLGVDNPAGMIYALRRDVVVKSGAAAGTPLTALPRDAVEPGNVKLRSDKRARPLTLRVNVGDCLQIKFQNLLAPQRRDDEQPADRHAGIHVNGMVLVDPDGAGPLTAIDSDGSFAGRNASSLAAPGESRSYMLLGEHENTYLLSDPGASTGAEAAGGSMAFGLFGAVNVEPAGTVWYRSQVTRDDLRAATTSTGAGGRPVIDYDAKDAAGAPLLKVLDAGGEIVHSDLNAIIAGPASDGYLIPKKDYPQSYWDNQIYNLNSARGREPFREFTVVFHDEIFARQAFPEFFAKDAATGHALHGVKDGFAINYGTGGIGNEILANRLGVGPMWDCTDCKAEEFFLTSWVVGDPAMVVDKPANSVRDADGAIVPGPHATKALYPDDPSNVHHSYLNDRVKFRNLHAGPKEHHIFHLHAHQWEFTPNTKRSGYLDSQLIGPGSGYTYEIAYGGSGNRNKTAGDAIFHCHFYPHFAQGMWEFWRVHDTFEQGTKLDADGVPVSGSRALPDGEITAGTPIPGLVPLPGRPMAPMPQDDTTVVPYDLNGDGTADSSQVDANGDGRADLAQNGFDLDPTTNPAVTKPLIANPGFPFWVPGVAGHRPPTAPLDIVDDGGLPRHVITGGKAEEFHTRLDVNKTLLEAKALYVPEKGTTAERKAMDFHAKLFHPTALPSGKAVDGANPLPADPSQPVGGRQLKGFETNGLPPQPGAPYADPCRSDPTATNGFAVTQTGSARRYRGAVIQLDAVLNKLGWHFPQQRILSLWGDVGDTLAGRRAPEPLVMRLGVNDCATYLHTNLVPNVYDLDDYQVRTPTDVIGQHIHLVKFDVTSADGSGNGFNYEDGTFSPEEVRERIHAIRERNGCAAGDASDPNDPAPRCPVARKHPFFGGVAGAAEMAVGARTTVQRWYADPVLNDSWDEGHGSVFTHDHFGPSTHQQVGLYSTVLVEPRGSKWRDPETGTLLGSRTTPIDDGGPTSWRADILTADPASAHREYYLEYSDFQQAYQPGGGKPHTQSNEDPRNPQQIRSYADFKNAINPSFRQDPGPGHEADLFQHPDRCPPFAGADRPPRPCPEAISADDIGTAVVNYRNEPIAARVFDPATKQQATGERGDLSLAFQSRTDRAIPALNTQPTTYPALTKGVQPGDPWTPMLRGYMGDRVRIRGQVGATEEQHNMFVEGLKWRQEPLHPDSGWRNSQAAGISEYFSFDIPLLPTSSTLPRRTDHMYTMGAATEDLWNGIWGILRAYRDVRTDLKQLPNNDNPSIIRNIANELEYDEICPQRLNGEGVRFVRYDLTAVRAADVLGPNGLTYNSRRTPVDLQRGDGPGERQGAGPLIDPTALIYVRTTDLVTDAVTGKPTGLKAGTPVEPIVLRAAAGDCLKVTLRNALPATVPDEPRYNALPPVLHKDEGVDGTDIVSFGANDLRPSSLVGVRPQLLTYDLRRSEGFVAGANPDKLVRPGGAKVYTWFAGTLDTKQRTSDLELVSRPVEYGGAGLLPADVIKGPGKGLLGAVAIEPKGASWAPDPGRWSSATITHPDGTVTRSFREFVTVVQDDVTFRYANDCQAAAANLQCAVPAIHSEQDTPEDAEDSGQRAINYGAEPLWFRLGIAPNTPFSSPAFRDNVLLHKVFSNRLDDPADGVTAVGDPQTAVFKAAAGEQVRMRMVQPGGHARGHVFAVHGHNWQREPYVADSDRETWTRRDDPTSFATATPAGTNDTSQWVGSQEGFGPTNHFDLLLGGAGGRSGPGGDPTQGDYLFRDQSSFGNLNGLWGLLRVK